MYGRSIPDCLTEAIDMFSMVFQSEKKCTINIQFISEIRKVFYNMALLKLLLVLKVANRIRFETIIILL